MTRAQEITDLTVCRAVFAAWVFIYHVDLYLRFSDWLGPFSGLIRRGYLGVDGFFILSGMILARAHPEAAKSRLGALNFWGRRLARIYPVHVAVLLLLAAIFWVGVAHGVTPRDGGRFSAVALLENLGLVQGWGFGAGGAWNYPAWSVSAEWAGYLAFPVLWGLIAYFEALVAVQIVIAGFAVLGLLIAMHHGSLNFDFSLGLARFFPEFVIGLASARLVPRYADEAPVGAMWKLGAVMALAGAAGGVELVAVGGLWLVLLAFVMQADAERPAVLARVRGLRGLGRLSYSFYMGFAPAELLVTRWFRREAWDPAGRGWLFAGVILALTLGIAGALYFIVERPCRRGIDGWLEARAPAPAGAVSLSGESVLKSGKPPQG
jgi:peptidoglycan/LPS O-acetylase OafA/YrhL